MISDYNNYMDNVDSIFSSMLMKPVDIITHFKTEHVNRVILYKHDDFGINIHTESVKKGKLSTKTVYVPYPFEITVDKDQKNVFHFDYRLEKMFKGAETVKTVVESIKKDTSKGVSGFFNTVVTLSTTP